MKDETDDLRQLARRLATPDLDADRAAAIAARARRAVGQLAWWRLIEPIAIGVLTSSYFVWAIAQIYSADFAFFGRVTTRWACLFMST